MQPSDFPELPPFPNYPPPRPDNRTWRGLSNEQRDLYCAALWVWLEPQVTAEQAELWQLMAVYYQTGQLQHFIDPDW